MEKNKYKFRIAGLLAILLVMIACEPQMKDKPEIGAAPTEDQLDFTLTPVTDDFHVAVANTSSVTGIAYWDFGNGTKGSGVNDTTKFPLEGDYTVKLTLVTSGGVASVTKSYSQTKTDFSIFTDPVYVNLTGGIDEIAGKTWVLDVATTGHIGVGPNTDPTGLSWWACPPNGKSGTGLMDDEITFKLDGFVVVYNNGPDGKSYVKGYRKDDAALATIYTNPVQNKDDWDVNYTTPATGSFTLMESGGSYSIVLNGDAPIFPCFDVGAKDNTYKIVQVGENILELTALCSYESWTNWHYYLIPKGYVKPSITYTVNATEGTDNDVACSVTGYTIPAGQSVTGITWNFGDGSAEVAGGKDEVVNHTFMRAGPYTVTASLATSLGVLTGTKSITLLNNNSAYVPFQLGEIVVYNDFSEVQSIAVAGQDGSFSIVDNPSKVYPNKSLKVGKFVKTDNQWANAYMLLNPGYRFDLRLKNVFSIKVYGTAGDQILLKMENTDLGGNAWTTGTNDVKFTIANTNKWETFEYDFSGVGSNGSGSIVATDVVADSRFNHDYYNVVRIMINPGNGSGAFTFYLDDLSGPHVEGITK
jgi:hypothetical protein